MSKLDRRDFMVAGSMLGGAMALGAANTARAEHHEGAMQHLSDYAPGSVDKNGEYTLPPLPYPYDALSEVIDEQTMKLHHDLHHAGYVRGLKNANAKLAEARESANFDLVSYWSEQAAFHGAGHTLHCIFWDSLGPSGSGTMPEGDLNKYIKKDFGNIDAMVAHFSAASAKVQGSGWGIVAYNVLSDKLEILQALNHQINTPWSVIPILVNDVWEHAYYLKYQNKRGAYVDAFPTIIDWKRVGQRFDLILSKAKGS